MVGYGSMSRTLKTVAMDSAQLVSHLASYAAYHRDRRNIATHFLGIPMILLAAQGLLALIPSPLEALPAPAMLATTLVCAFWYLRLDLRLGSAMVLQLTLGALLVLDRMGAPGVRLGREALWVFIAGWVIQFLGHLFEGRKPAFLDDLRGLLIGPLFVMAELGFLLGLRTPLRKAIEDRAGPLRAPRSAAA